MNEINIIVASVSVTAIVATLIAFTIAQVARKFRAINSDINVALDRIEELEEDLLNEINGHRRDIDDRIQEVERQITEEI